MCWHNCYAKEELEADDLQEDIKVLYPWAAVKEYGRQVDAMGDTLSSPEAVAKRNAFMHKMEKIGHFWEKRGPKYLPHLKAYGESEDVRKVHRAERAIMRTHEWKEFTDDVEDLVEDAVEADGGKRPTRAGWYEWIDNEDLADMAEDVQDIMRSFKKLAHTREVRVKNELGMKSLSNPHAVKVW